MPSLIIPAPGSDFILITTAGIFKSLQLWICRRLHPCQLLGVQLGRYIRPRRRMEIPSRRKLGKIRRSRRDSLSIDLRDKIFSRVDTLSVQSK